MKKLVIIFLFLWFFVQTSGALAVFKLDSNPDVPSFDGNPGTVLEAPDVSDVVDPGLPVRDFSLQAVVGDQVIAIAKDVVSVAMVLAVLMVVIGGFIYITSGGNDDKIKQGRSIIVFALIGILVIFFSYALVRMVTKIDFTQIPAVNTEGGGNGGGGADGANGQVSPPPAGVPTGEGFNPHVDPQEDAPHVNNPGE